MCDTFHYITYSVPLTLSLIPPFHHHSLGHSITPLCLSLPRSRSPLSSLPLSLPFSPLSPFLSFLSLPCSPSPFFSPSFPPPSLSPSLSFLFPLSFFSQVYGIIERLSPGTLKIELFGRMHNCQPNWLTVGNQLQGVHLVEEDRAESFFARYPNGDQDLFSCKLPQPPTLLPPR